MNLLQLVYLKFIANLFYSLTSQKKLIVNLKLLWLKNVIVVFVLFKKIKKIIWRFLFEAFSTSSMVLRRFFFFFLNCFLDWCRLNARLKLTYFVINEFTTISLFKIYSQSLLLVEFPKKLIVNLKLLWLKMLLLYLYYLEK